MPLDQLLDQTEMPVEQELPVAIPSTLPPLAQRFQSLMDQNIPYVLLNGEEGLPFTLEQGDPILMLYDSMPPGKHRTPFSSIEELHGYRGRDRQIVSLLGLKPYGATENVTYELVSGNKRRQITLIPKGVQFLPEAFESRILNSRHAVNRVIAVPDDEVRALALLHYRIFRTDFLKDEPFMRNLLKQYVLKKVGPVQTCDIPQFALRK